MISSVIRADADALRGLEGGIFAQVSGPVLCSAYWQKRVVRKV